MFYVHHLFLKIVFSKRFFKRDIKLFLIGGENEFSILFKITYSILIYCIIQVILKGGEIVHKFYNLLISPIYIFFQNTFNLYVISYITKYLLKKQRILFFKFLHFWILTFHKGENVLHFYIISPIYT